MTREILVIAVVSNVRTLNWCILNIFHEIFFFLFSILHMFVLYCCNLYCHGKATGWKNTGTALHDPWVIWSMIQCLSSALNTLKLFVLITNWNFGWLQPLQSRSSDTANGHFNNFGAVQRDTESAWWKCRDFWGSPQSELQRFLGQYTVSVRNTEWTLQLEAKTIWSVDFSISFKGT